MTQRTIKLARTEIPRLGLGSNRLTPTAENLDFLREAVDAGLRHVDSAHLYTDGESERAIGEGLGSGREEIVIATKGGYSGSGDPESLRAQVDQSLKSLRAETIDLYYLHRVDPETPMEESLGAIAEMRDAGKIREIGISSVDVGQIETARSVVPIAAVQNHFNLEERGHDDVVDHCEEHGIVFVPYFPLKGEGPPALAEMAERRGVSVQQVAIAWLLHRSPAMLPIPGTLSIEHLKENLAALEIELTDEELAALSS